MRDSDDRDDRSSVRAMSFEVLVLDPANDVPAGVCFEDCDGVEEELGVERHSIARLVDDDPDVDLCHCRGCRLGETHIE
jgi:hypothetical protein